MPNRYSRAVVVGATMSGLLAARALAECGNTERRQRQNAERACARRFTPHHARLTASRVSQE